MASKTSLIRAIKTFSVDPVLVALRAKPELLHYRDERGRNWLHFCASINVLGKKNLHSGDSIRLAEALIELGLDKDAAAFTEGTWQATPLWFAVARGRNYRLAAFLLDSGASPEHCLWAASLNEDADMINLLLDRGANIEAIAEDETPLLGAVKYSKFAMAELLLASGSNPDFQDSKGMTALHYMLKKDSGKQYFEAFRDHTACIDIAGPDGRTVRAIMMQKRDIDFHALADQFKQ